MSPGVITLLTNAFPFLLVFSPLFHLLTFINVIVHAQILDQYHFDHYKYWIDTISIIISISYTLEKTGGSVWAGVTWSVWRRGYRTLPHQVLYALCSADTLPLRFHSPDGLWGSWGVPPTLDACVLTWWFVFCPLQSSLAGVLVPGCWITHNTMMYRQYLFLSSSVTCHPLFVDSSCSWLPGGSNHRLRGKL